MFDETRRFRLRGVEQEWGESFPACGSLRRPGVVPLQKPSLDVSWLQASKDGLEGRLTRSS